MDSVIRMFEQDPISRHEAGEGWAAHGLDPEVLSAIALREALKIKSFAVSESQRPGIEAEVELAGAAVERMKYDHDLPLKPPSA